jgi:large subunit ribosomal protein L18e
MKRTGPTNILLRLSIKKARRAAVRNKSAMWRSVYRSLLKPARYRCEVNMSRIQRYAKANSTLVVPGKVLGTGELSKPVTVAATGFTKAAEAKIRAAGGETITLEELIERNPKGSGVVIMK